MELFIGVVIGFFIQSMVRFGWRVLNPPRPSPQPPRTGAQLANQQLYEEQTRHHPRVVSVRYQRRTKRGRRLREVENEKGLFEE